MADTTKPGTEIAVGIPLSGELVQQFAQMAVMIPDEGDDAYESILTQILGVSDWEKLSDPWRSLSAEKLAGKRIRIDKLVRRPSDYQTGLGLFLVVHYTDVKTGETGVWPTGSVAIVAQLAKAHAAGWLPIYAEVKISERATKDGYKPHHLEFFGRADKPQAGKAPF